MGTNYYLHEKPACSTCGHRDEPLHIGKSSAGWVFSLHVIPEDGIHELHDWQYRWSAPDATIESEYGEVLTPHKMSERIMHGSSGKAERSTDWLVQNSAEPGPNGLVRHRIGQHCIAHGARTWDCIRGEFS